MVNGRTDAEDMAARHEERNGDSPQWPRWIPVTKRLPEHHQLVLVFDPECFGFGLAALTKDQGWRGEEVNMYAPTHWMPLPAPPEEEKP